MMMLTIIIILLIVSIGLFVRLFVLTKEIKNMRTQLKSYNDLTTEKKIDVSLLDKNIENLGEEINRLMAHYVTAKREKIRSDNELKEAVANISHDLRTPLTSIKGYIQMLESSKISDADKKDYLIIIKDRATRLEHLVNDFFELSKIESLDYELKYEHISLVSLVNESILSFYQRFVDIGIEPRIQIDDQNIHINSDRSAVNRVVENLISNAIFYTVGSVNIGLKEDEDYAYLWVENEADVENEEELEKFFDRFYIADKSRTGQSTGLGLSIVKSLMDKMNGIVTAEYIDNQLRITCRWTK